MTTKYDAIIIDTGQAGPSLAGRLAGTGMKVAILERSRRGDFDFVTFRDLDRQLEEA